jgi:hypothetical protein
LKRFNIRALLIDDFSEITEFLTELVNQYRRRTVLVSASATDYAPWGEAAVSEFAQDLGRALAADNTRIATGLGAGIGNAVFTGALRELMRTKVSRLEDALVLRPFPQAGSTDELAQLWEGYRQELVAQAGIALFLFGSKREGTELVIADGMVREFEIARTQGVVVLPIGATGAAAEFLSQKVISSPDEFTPELDVDGRSQLAALEKRTDNLKSLISPILALVRKLQGKA